MAQEGKILGIADLDLCTYDKLTIQKSYVDKIEESKNQRSFASGKNWRQSEMFNL